MTPRGTALLSLLAFFASSVWGCGPAVPEYTLVQSASGKTIKFERKRQIALPDGSLALQLSYQTDLAIEDAESLRAEVSEVWRHFQGEAEQAEITTGLIQARALRGERWSRIGRSQRFAFRRDGTGNWKLVEREAARTTAVKPL